MHRDLALRNVLLQSRDHIRLADFGMGRDLWEDELGLYLKRSTARIPIRWMAPESLNDNIYDSRSDV